MMHSVLMVAAGGAIGAALRFLWSVGILRLLGGPTGFPVAIMGANILGSFLMGVFVVYAAQRGSTYLAPFVMIGVLGGFTTFSAFSLETVTLLERGDVWQAGLYVGLSVVLSVAALMLGLWVTRMVVA